MCSAFDLNCSDCTALPACHSHTSDYIYLGEDAQYLALYKCLLSGQGQSTDQVLCTSVFLKWNMHETSFGILIGFAVVSLSRKCALVCVWKNLWSFDLIPMRNVSIQASSNVMNMS